MNTSCDYKWCLKGRSIIKFLLPRNENAWQHQNKEGNLTLYLWNSLKDPEQGLHQHINNPHHSPLGK